jgi:hypothetical protein
MRKSVAILAFAALLATPLFAAYTVVLKDGTRYDAQAKWTMQGNKALIKLKSGQTMLIDPALIDVPRSEQMTKMGIGASSNVVSLDNAPQQTAPAPKQEQPSLGSSVRLRGRGAFGATPGATETEAPASAGAAPGPVADQLDGRLKDNFERAFENVGIYDYKLSGTNRHVRAELTADSEDKVFNSLSATAFLVVRNAGVDRLQIDMVELFLKTTTGGAAGRFQMNRSDAEAINAKRMSLPEYFVRRVIY